VQQTDVVGRGSSDRGMLVRERDERRLVRARERFECEFVRRHRCRGKSTRSGLAADAALTTQAANA